MTRKREDEKYKKMYEEYNKGFSLSEVGWMFGVTRQSVYSGFKLRNYKLREKIELPYQYFNGKKYTLRKSIGYYGLSNEKRTLIHRDIWEFYNGKIPKGFDIHHKDRDKSNNKIENLELINHAEHSKRFATGNNQYVKKVKR